MNVDSKKLQLLRTPYPEPTEEVLKEALGNTYSIYCQFVEGLSLEDIRLNWKFYKDGHAWLGKGIYGWTGPRGGKKETTVCWLSIWDGFFKVTVYVPDREKQNMMNLPIQENLRKEIAETRKLGEKLKFFPVVFEVYTKETLEDLSEVLSFKKAVR